MNKKPQLQDRFLTLLVYGSVISVSWVLFLVLFDICVTGGGSLNLEFLFSEPTSAGRTGGIAPILMSTLFILLITMMVSLPLGLGSAILLSEFSSEEKLFGRLVRRSLDVLAGVPSICFGLFGNAFFCKRLGLGFSILSGGLTLACMVLPILIRSTEEGFRSVPKEYRLSAAALGLSRISTLWHLLLPAAIPGFLVGFVLGVGRALAETAALIFTSGYVDRFPRSLMDSGRALSIHIYDLSMNISGGDENAYRSAFVLVVLLLVINVSASWVSERWLKRKIVLS
ncbi:MAG: phosphate ABC transporter permease PstA [Deltaproteobacteria bacterium]|nr:phosphate ABC transporter permease PstA [Deltaproteobacteria bacterium]